ncbi:hypothetical protein C8R47DRAFT_720292 [Mycena vitilis]|nr:hypothetical protein C8R47DRAFT_720292 [Mycena vitilis]
MGRHHAGHRTGRPDDGIMGDAQYTAGSGVGTAIPPAGNFNHGNQTYGADASTTGVVGSQSLKAQGMQKEQEARGLKIQSQELAEAERLEKEAAMRRERAVAHGAHPDNRHVGGMGAGAAGSYD